MSDRPQARTERLVTEDVGEELVVFDQNSSIAHNLSPLAARVWRECDGTRDAPAIAAQVGASDEHVAAVLNELEALQLIDGASSQAERPAGRLSRRGALKRIGATGLAGAAAPAIFSLAIATPLAHASTLATQCGSCATSSCASGLTCDPTYHVCIPTNCRFESCSTSGTARCSLGIFTGTCMTGCGTGGTLCCTT
jgi:hypothetical protein